MIKLIVTDMDGTFLDDNKKMPEGTEKMLDALKEKNIRFVVASGRQYPSLEKHFPKHIEDIVFVAENGAFVVENQKEVFSFSMDPEDVILCLDILLALPGVEPVVCGKHCEYTRSPEVHAHFTHPSLQYHMHLVEDLYDYAAEAIKMFVVFPDEKTTEKGYFELEKRLHTGLHFVTSDATIIDIGGAGVTKGAALARLQEQWEITPEETVVFGDQYNDKEMLELGHYSYAMENAADGMEKYARFRGGSNNDGFVLKEVYRLMDVLENGEKSE